MSCYIGSREIPEVSYSLQKNEIDLNVYRVVQKLKSFTSTSALYSLVAVRGRITGLLMKEAIRTRWTMLGIAAPYQSRNTATCRLL